jgi:hypothetical protein
MAENKQLRSGGYAHHIERSQNGETSRWQRGRIDAKHPIPGTQILDVVADFHDDAGKVLSGNRGKTAFLVVDGLPIDGRGVGRPTTDTRSPGAWATTALIAISESRPSDVQLYSVSPREDVNWPSAFRDKLCAC